MRRGSRMGIDATKPPTRRVDDRDYFTRSVPRGWETTRVQDWID